jgi:hypothetical protein
MRKDSRFRWLGALASLSAMVLVLGCSQPEPEPLQPAPNESGIASPDAIAPTTSGAAGPSTPIQGGESVTGAGGGSLGPAAKEQAARVGQSAASKAGGAEGGTE